MFIKRLKQNVYDVFVGTGWNNWTRVQRHQGNIHIVAGNRLDKTTFNHVKERVCR